MRVVVDTNVFLSGVFFKGAPSEVLGAWRDGVIELVVSPEILDEYHRVSAELQRKYSGIDVAEFLHLLVVRADVCSAPALPIPVCRDPDDDKFIACALAGEARVIITGDKDLLAIATYEGIKILTPRAFLDALGA